MAKRGNYNDLYYFMLVVREGSFTAAAQRLGLAQSGISRAIRELEARLGVRLLVRTTRKLSLTQAGEQLYQATLSGFDSLNQGLAPWHITAKLRPEPLGSMSASTALIKFCYPGLPCFSCATRISAWS
jgi:DNA-binding transcriptional LysR family regulator